MPTTTTTRSLLRALPFLLVAAVGPASAAPPAPLGPGGAPVLAEGIAAFNAAAEFPLPKLSAADSAQLLSGEVVRLFDQPGGDPEGPRRASGSA